MSSNSAVDTNAIEMFTRPVEPRPALEVQLPVLEHIQRILGDRIPFDLVYSQSTNRNQDQIRR